MSSKINVIAHNVTSMFTSRQLGITDKNLAKSSEKLSSGFKINRAADDAAGLAISEKMRRLIRGLDKGSSNIIDGINLVQTAEGALNEVHDMLQRMNELAVKGLSCSVDHQDRQAIQNEINALYSEIRRVGDTTTFNELNILQGDPLHAHKVATGTTDVVKVDIIREAEGMPSAYVSYEGVSSSNGQNVMTLGGAKEITQPSSDGTSYKTENNTTVSNSKWSTGLDDNYGCSINFSKLAGTYGDNLEFYNALNEFVGAGFYTTCNTCSNQYNIVFNAGSNNNYFVPDDKVNFGGAIYVDLTNLLEQAKTATTEAESQALTTQFVNLIASKASSSPAIRDHYTRYVTNANYPYKLFIYDFRDYTDDPNDYRYGYTIPPDGSRKTGSIGSISGRICTDNIVAEVVYGTYYTHEPLNIQHGDDSDNNSTLHLPNLNAMFNVYSKYGFLSPEASLTLEEYFPPVTVTTTTGGSYISYTETIPSYTYQQASYTPVPPRVYYEAGEKKIEYFPPKVSYKTVTVPEQTVTKYKYTGGVTTSTTTPEHYGDLNYTILDVIKDLISSVNDMRTKLGASQNRLEHAYKYNENEHENLQRSESTIRDTNMAAEMVNYSRNNIISQADKSILANANNNPQSVLNLLKND